MFQALAWLVSICYQLIPNYGVAITLMTIVVMLVLTPLTWKSTRSMLEMQRLQPEIKKLQAKHKDDRQKLNEEMMAFYKEHKINPVGGCLPMVLQMPVFFIMYRVIRGLAHTVLVGAIVGGGAASGVAANATVTPTKVSGTITAGKIESGTLHEVAIGEGSSKVTYKIKDGTIKNGVVDDAKLLDPKTSKPVGEIKQLEVTNGEVKGEPSYLSKSSKLYKDLHTSNGKLHSFGMDLAQSVSKQLHRVAFLTLLPYLVLLALVVVTQYIQTKQMSGRNASAQQNPQAQMMQRITPLMFGYFSFIVPAGLNVYFLASALFRIGQQELMYRYDPVLMQHVKEQAKEVEAKTVEARSFVPKNQPTKNGKKAKGPGKGAPPSKQANRPGGKPQQGRRKKAR
jgi:YidC/Oxa1 family membrane protein insertase